MAELHVGEDGVIRCPQPEICKSMLELIQKTIESRIGKLEDNLSNGRVGKLERELAVTSNSVVTAHHRLDEFRNQAESDRREMRRLHEEQSKDMSKRHDLHSEELTKLAWKLALVIGSLNVLVGYFLSNYGK